MSHRLSNRPANAGRVRSFLAAATLLLGLGTCQAFADPTATTGPVDNLPPAIASAGPAAADSTGDSNRYGLFGLLDHRSLYGKGVYPEPFIVDDSDGEVNEFRLDWSHQGGKGQNVNVMTAELEHGNGIWTLELEVPYEYDTSNTFDPATGSVDHTRIHGFDNINPGARMPVYEYVSPDEAFETTFGTAIEVGIPSNSPLGKNTEIVPKIFNDTRIGEHLTFQSIIGWSFLRGSADGGGGEQHLEYGGTIGWTIPHNELPIPGVQDFIPLFEFQGDLLTTTHDAGQNSLDGNIAFRANLFAIGRIQPRLGFGVLVPLDKGAG